MGEIEEVTAAYEEAVARGDELRRTVAGKEEAVARLKQDKLRADHAVAMLRSEVQSLTEKAEQLAKHSEASDTLKKSFEEQLRKANEALGKREGEVRGYEALLGQQKAALKEAQANAREATTTLKAAQDAEKRARAREQKAQGDAVAEAAQVKRLSAEREALQRKLARANEAASLGGGGKGQGGGMSVEAEILESYRKKVKCSLCLHNDKDAIISKCMHAFCRECIQRRLDNRNRKCPACGLQFDFQSVKDLFLTC